MLARDPSDDSPHKPRLFCGFTTEAVPCGCLPKWSGYVHLGFASLPGRSMSDRPWFASGCRSHAFTWASEADVDLSYLPLHDTEFPTGPNTCIHERSLLWLLQPRGHSETLHVPCELTQVVHSRERGKEEETGRHQVHKGRCECAGEVNGIFEAWPPRIDSFTSFTCPQLSPSPV